MDLDLRLNLVYLDLSFIGLGVVFGESGGKDKVR